MNFRSSLPVMLMSGVGLLTLGFLAPYGGNNAVADPTTTTRPPSAAAEVRPGCGTFCQSAGQYGGAGDQPVKPAMTIVSNGTVTAEADGYVPVTVKCDLPVQCNGALILSLGGDYWQTHGQEANGDFYKTRSDLHVDTGATQTIGVPLPASAVALLRSNGPTSCGVTADSRESQEGSDSEYQHVNRADLTVAGAG
jgi:hypothetical protein